MTNNETTTFRHFSSRTASGDNAFAKIMVEYLNYNGPRSLYFDGVLVTKDEVNRRADGLIMQGTIIETPGTPYTYALADWVN